MLPDVVRFLGLGGGRVNSLRGKVGSLSLVSLLHYAAIASIWVWAPVGAASRSLTVPFAATNVTSLIPINPSIIVRWMLV